MTRILITGVRGKTGTPLAASLAARGDVEVLGGSSDPATVTAVGVTPVAFDWDDPRGRAAAVDGVDAVYLVRPDRPDAPELAAALLAQLPAATRVVLLSEKDDGSFAPDDWALRVERTVRDSGRGWTIVRPGWFMQVLADERFMRDEVAEHGRLAFAAGGAGLAWIDAHDIAAVVEVALLDAGHDGRVHELSGPETLTVAETAERLAAALGRPVRGEDVTIDEAVAGTTGFDRDLTTLTLERVRAGVFAERTDTVERVTGHPPRSLAEWLEEERPFAPSGQA